jgi:hypothetical protein
MTPDSLDLSPIPYQIQTGVGARALRRLLPFTEQIIRFMSSNDSRVVGRSRQTILLAEHFAYDPQHPLDNDWFPSFRQSIESVTDAQLYPYGIVLVHWLAALQKLKPSYHPKWGNQSGHVPDTLSEGFNTAKALAQECIPDIAPAALASDWAEQVQFDIGHYASLVSAINPSSSDHFKCSLKDMEQVFSYFPDCYDEPDTEYQLDLFASNSLFRKVKLRLR